MSAGPKLDLTTHCALCGGKHPYDQRAMRNPLALDLRSWSGDATASYGETHEKPDRPDLLCKCKEPTDG